MEVWFGGGGTVGILLEETGVVAAGERGGERGLPVSLGIFGFPGKIVFLDFIIHKYYTAP